MLKKKKRCTDTQDKYTTEYYLIVVTFNFLQLFFVSVSMTLSILKNPYLFSIVALSHIETSGSIEAFC